MNPKKIESKSLWVDYQQICTTGEGLETILNTTLHCRSVPDPASKARHTHAALRHRYTAAFASSRNSCKWRRVSKKGRKFPAKVWSFVWVVPQIHSQNPRDQKLVSAEATKPYVSMRGDIALADSQRLIDKGTRQLSDSIRQTEDPTCVRGKKKHVSIIYLFSSPV